MEPFFKHFDLRLVSPSFDSPLTDTLMELNHLRKLELGGTTAPWIFFQLKEIFQLLESVNSARIEGNQTTILEYVEQKIENKERSSEKYSEIANVESAMVYIEKNIDESVEITTSFIKELHQLTVSGLKDEGDHTPGIYRRWNVKISNSPHLPPKYDSVQEYMNELISFINKSDAGKYDLLKTAIAHHRFSWVHPFGNGNGRVVRLLTYAMMIKYGFNVKEGKLINPTAVFCNDRNYYYQKLKEADEGDDESLLSWCDYVLNGILDEVSKVNKLLNFDYLYKRILVPTIKYAAEREYLNEVEVNILMIGIKKQEFRSTDLNEVLSALSARQITHQIAKMKDSGFIQPLKENGRTYFINFMNNFLMRALVKILEREGFIPAIDK
ncbi:MAG: Fic family protein [Candidatus Marinimicrobia bacterium]|jgi:Fic family protein|nr:Fic family protein [Nitrosomonadales bacterium]MBT6671977.1 Fic family protein [Lentimicrobiaceae bacterium]MBT7195484.1 Fic family protein [Candidatus Neomarinimicrobiota bacterium]